MAEKATRGWSERVREVQDLLRRFKLIRSRLDRAPTAGHQGAGERVGLEREARSLHSQMVRSARGLIADAGRVSPRRVHFDADQKEPGALRTHENAAKGRLDWSMAFGPSALSRSGKAKTVGIVDSLRRRLAGERRSFKERDVSPAHDELIDVAQRWSWLPNLEHLDRWSEEFLARFDRSLAWFGLDLAQRFEPALHDGSPDLIFEEPGLGAIAHGVAATGFPAFGGGSAGAPAAMSGSSVAAGGGGFAVGSGVPSVGGVASSSGPAPFSGVPHVTAGASAVGGGASRAASLPSIPPIGGVRSPGWSAGAAAHPAGAAAHPVGRATGWPASPIVSPRAQFAPRWLGGAPIPSDVMRRRDHEPFTSPHRVSAPGLAWPSARGRSSAPQLGVMPTTPPRTLAGVPWLRAGAPGAPIPPSPSIPAAPAAARTSGGLGGSVPPQHHASRDRKDAGRALGSAVAGAPAGFGATSPAPSRSARVGHPMRPRLPVRSSSTAPSTSALEPLEPVRIPALGRRTAEGRARKQRPGDSSMSVPPVAHIVQPGAMQPPAEAAHGATRAKMFAPYVPAAAGSSHGSPRRGPLPSALGSVFPVLAASPASPFHVLDRFLDAPRGAPRPTGRPLRSSWGDAPAQHLAGPAAAILGDDSSVREAASRPGRRHLPLPGILHAAPRPSKILGSLTPAMAEVPTPHGGAHWFPLLAAASHAPLAGARRPTGVRDPHFVPMLGTFGEHAAAPLARLAGLPSFRHGVAGPQSAGAAPRFARPTLPPLIGVHAGEPMARGASGIAQPTARFAPAHAGGPRNAAHRWLAVPPVAAPGPSHVRPEPLATRPNADGSSRALTPLTSRAPHHPPAAATTARSVIPAMGASTLDATPTSAASHHAAVGRAAHPAVPSAAATPAVPWTWPEAWATPASLEPLAAAAGYAGPGPRAFPLPIGAHNTMAGATALRRVTPSELWNPDRLIARPPIAHHVSPMLHGLLSAVPEGAPRIPGLWMPRLNIPRLGTLSAVPAATEHPHPAMFGGGGAPMWRPGGPFEATEGGHAASPEMSYVILGSRNRGASTEQRPARVITETHFIEAPPERERERAGAARILKASVGRDHRPQPSGTAGIGQRADETRQGTINPPDLDRLAAQIYGRIKQRLAIDRERRGFVR